jgi:hypothetical protein
MKSENQNHILESFVLVRGTVRSHEIQVKNNLSLPQTWRWRQRQLWRRLGIANHGTRAQSGTRYNIFPYVCIFDMSPLLSCENKGRCKSKATKKHSLSPGGVRPNWLTLCFTSPSHRMRACLLKAAHRTPHLAVGILPGLVVSVCTVCEQWAPRCLCQGSVALLLHG